MKAAMHIFWESFTQAMNELKGNKLRTFLSLLGVTIGIFCIISITTFVDSLERNIKSSVAKLGSNTLYIEKWPWMEEDYAWWDYLNRPNVSLQEWKSLRTELPSAAAISMLASKDAKIKFQEQSLENGTIVMVTEDFDKTWNLDFRDGRFFVTSELTTGSAAAIIGYTIYEELFPTGVNPIGKELSIDGRKVSIVGLLQKEGKGLIDISFDKTVIIPMQYGLQFTTLKGNIESNQQILCRAHDGVTLDAFKDEIRGAMRNIRSLKPKEKDNFAINEMSMIANAMQPIFSIINWIGIFIGGFSLLVGGFGIANIMFVSVKERTNLIGIKKALGAKKIMIAFEFLIEAVILCIFGGIIGMLIVYLLALVINRMVDFEVFMSLRNFSIGIIISSIIGVLAGLIPAILAGNLDPVEAIRSK